MEEYIGRNALLQEIANLKKSPWYNDDYGFGTKQARHDGVVVVEDLCIKQAPAADVVEVVRCKDCEFFISRDGISWCEEHSDGWGDHTVYVDEEDFCSDGIRKEE